MNATPDPPGPTDPTGPTDTDPTGPTSPTSPTDTDAMGPMNPTDPTNPMNPMDRLLAESACERLILDFVHRLDLGDPSSVAELFTADGIWAWPAGDRLITGREALREYFGSRPADRLSRRLMSNVLVTVTSPDTATAISYFTTYRVDGYRGGMVPAGPPVQVGHYEDTFRRQPDDTWLLAGRILRLPFGGPTPRGC